MLAQKIQSAFEPELEIGEHRIRISLSIGVSVGQPGDDPDALIELADRAQYRAKRQGGHAPRSPRVEGALRRRTDFSR